MRTEVTDKYIYFVKTKALNENKIPVIDSKKIEKFKKLLLKYEAKTTRGPRD